MTSPLILPADAPGIARAAGLLADGDLVAFATETVYGLGADARNGRAVAAIFDAKGRPRFNPLIVHVPDIDAARTYVEWSDAADILARTFWPGPLTLVLPLLPDHGLSPLVTAGLSTLALRVPAKPSARALLKAFGGPVAAPSANPSGRISPTTATHVRQGLGDRIAAILDDGACPVGLESTIIAFSPAPVLMRAGGLPAEAIQTALGTALPRAPHPKSEETVTAPGQLNSHYAPRAPLRTQVTEPNANELLLGFGPMPCDLNLSETGDLQEAAANLFAHLHQLDKLHRPIAVAPIPDTGLGCAINDRLSRAAAPRAP
ncbi:Threonylcarbamoyl-AMP synthase [Roseobacter fucihabitans]|uniref:Threonylcarbamoyl-AMP synthase n=2 Tax=Roseobacter fucihabitans TaxID=1537242 RepID=A0ABZ2BXG4_9RHOB|nr:L-threonylcarbamoyladenylate synthase [Roseobacter litoralis]MBC6967159.1 Threonylcarbamoyl-AMP synthase [Roseobacter litoralis]